MRYFVLIGACAMVLGVALLVARRTAGEPQSSLPAAERPTHAWVADVRRSIDEARVAVAAIVGENRITELQYEGLSMLSALDQQAEFSVKDTRERFWVRLRDQQVVRWVLGDRVLNLDLAHPVRTERDLMRRYFPHVVAERAFLAHCQAQADSRGAVYYERLSEHAFCPKNFCAFQWAGAPQRLVQVRANWEPLRRDARPRLTYQDARQQAADFALRWPDVKSASVLEPDANMVERGQLAEVRYD